MNYQAILAAAQAALKYGLPIIEQTVSDIQAGIPAQQADFQATQAALKKWLDDGKALFQKVADDARAKLAQ